MFSDCSAMVEGQMWDMEVDRRECAWVKGRSRVAEEGNDCDNEDRPRPRPVGGEEALWMGGLPFGFPTPPLLCLTSRIARAPKLSRRAKGVAGLLLLADVEGA
jgi:hypothetical protein